MKERISEENFVDRLYWSISLIQTKEESETRDQFKDPSGFPFCNLPIFPRAHRKRLHILTLFFLIGFSLQLDRFPFVKMKWENSRNLIWPGNCSKANFQSWEQGYFIRPPHIPECPDTSGVGKGGRHAAPTPAFHFSTKKTALESWQNKWSSVYFR